MSVDISVVVPSHNGSARLGATLAHVAAQAPPVNLKWEVVLVDNASTDDTSGAAQDAWPYEAPVPLRIVREPQLGLRHAHTRGFAEARGEIVTWVDDDNWIAPDWLEVAVTVMHEHPEVGACGGFNEPVCEITPPDWFDTYQGWYAAGAQGSAGGDVTASRGFLWGAGLTVRKRAWDHLVGHGFRPLLIDRLGSSSYSSGGDSEICFALRLCGWRLWFEPRLRLRHFLLAPRLEWQYLRRLCRGVGASTVGFDPYYQALEGTPAGGRGRRWIDAARPLIADLGSDPGKLWDAWRHPREGEADVLEVERKFGRLSELLRQRGGYDRSLRAIQFAPWRRPPGAGERPWEGPSPPDRGLPER